MAHTAANTALDLVIKKLLCPAHNVKAVSSPGVTFAWTGFTVSLIFGKTPFFGCSRLAERRGQFQAVTKIEQVGVLQMLAEAAGVIEQQCVDF